LRPLPELINNGATFFYTRIVSLQWEALVAPSRLGRQRGGAFAFPVVRARAL